MHNKKNTHFRTDSYFNAASIKPFVEKDAVQFTPYQNNRGDMAKQVALLSANRSGAQKSRLGRLIVTLVLIVLAFVLGHLIRG